MKKIVSLLLAILLLGSFALADAASDAKLGLLKLMGVDGDIWTATINEHMKKFHDQDAVTMDNAIYYDSLTELLSALDSGEVKAISTNNSIARYITTRTDLYTMLENGGNSMGGYSMMVPGDAQETLALLNDAIAAMKADGTLNALQENYLYGDACNEVVQIPAFEGAATIRVAITGDLPPVDHVDENGLPMGFSSALLAEIANRAQVNIETVLVENTQRTDALSSGNADALFWVRNVSCPVEGCDGYHMHEEAGDAVVTESYFIDTLAALIKK